MTKYILAGGADRKFPTYGQNLTTEVFKSVEKPVRILSCFFSEPREDWESKFTDRQAWFHSMFGDDARVVLAMPDSFLQQVEKTDVVYLHGGDETLLAHYLDSYSDIEQVWDGKIIIGSSAGAEYLAQKYWTCDWRQIREGRGLVSLCIIPHFESEEYGKSDPRGPINWNEVKDNFQAALEIGGGVTILREGEFVVIEQ